ncbi:MAG TPA: acetyl-CoA carboxylase biotin carboxyl carrier protein [Stellaceae bacterium]|jgi:acetyl-CoA carboxylase biotin carboxyl carrier protein|nr:acetyl-CoA carboxylase biotin carboxyl carrier protein [Stellaceae bacterium]
MPTRSDLPIDSDLVRTLAALLDETGLTEIEYSVGDRRIRVARTAAALAPTVAVAAPAPAEAPTAPASAVAPVDHPGAVKAPMVGTAYIAPQPDQPPFVKLGDRVEEGRVLLIIEAMKVMNQIRAPKGGRVAEILIADGTPVEYGQVLMVIE